MDTKKEKVTCTTCKLIQADLSGDVYYMQTRFQQIWTYRRSTDKVTATKNTDKIKILF